MYRRRLFNLPDRQHLWDSSNSDEEEEKRASPSENKSESNIPVIDLTHSPEPTLLSSIQQQQQQQPSPPYVPTTLRQNSQRYSILPAFPTSIYNDQPTLLLANVPSMYYNVSLFFISFFLFIISQ
jgi:hypothetical protein